MTESVDHHPYSHNDAKGEFVRPETDFRDWVQADGSTAFAPEAGRYHLYVSLACPWAHRTLIMRRLKGLEDAIGVSIVDPVWNEAGWHFSDFPGAIPDTVNRQKDLVSIYRLADPRFDGDETTPVLWDKKRKTIVNNESLELIRMFDLEFQAIAKNKTDYYPAPLRARIDDTIAKLYPEVNNGVYRAGFATTQAAYEKAVRQLFESLDHWEDVLSRSRFLVGDRITEADVCFYTTLVRFDAVYFGHFKCNLKEIAQYPNLWGYLRDLFQTPGFGDTTNFEHIKRHYYVTHDWINPTRIVPAGPILDFHEPVRRAHLVMEV